MKDLSSTQFFQVESGPQIQAKDILEIVYKALSEKGYNPVNQIVGYIMSLSIMAGYNIYENYGTGLWI